MAGDAGKAIEWIGRFLPPAYVLRDMEELSLTENRALLVVGPRQSGKSTLIRQRLRDLSSHIFFLNMEDPLLKTACASAIDFAGAEVDFIVEHAGALHGMEVKISFLKRPLLSRSIRSFIEAHEPERPAVVNTSLEHELQLEKTLVNYITPAAFTEWLKKFS